MQNSDTARFLITGGSGFLGRALIEELFQLAEARGKSISVRVLDLRGGEHPRPVEWRAGSVTDAAAVKAACEGIDVVLHAAAMVDWGNTPEATLRAVNVGGTENVLAACRGQGVSGLVHTSTMDVVMGAGAIRGGDETLPYPDVPFDRYSATKAAGERAVLAANGADGLRTCVLRPCGMYGERDPYHMTAVYREAEGGKLAFRLGDGSAVFEHVYVGNVAYAHALAAFAMLAPAPDLEGEVFFVTDQPARNFFAFMQPFVEAWGFSFPSERRSIPKAVGMALGGVFETAARVLSPVVTLKPVITRSSVHIVCTDIGFETDKAHRALGYSPRYSTREAFERTVEDFKRHGPVAR